MYDIMTQTNSQEGIGDPSVGPLWGSEVVQLELADVREDSTRKFSPRTTLLFSSCDQPFSSC